MTMMDYGSQFTGSTISCSDTMSGSVGSVQPRIRTVRLVRPFSGTLPPPGITARHGPNLGFSIRGGREHGTGFFVSVVEPGSEAHRQGLKMGDQVIRINGFTIEDAVHKEVLQLISNHTHLTLKVRSVGMIPVKDRSTDSLSWQITSDCTSSTRSSPQLNDKIHDVRINIMVAPRTKLGCGICKGPEWKPGIFVQFTKEGGIAREAGLRPGDQILCCNNIDFSDVQFNEAVSIMKTSRQLDLVVRKLAGLELFPGESSGYNSSASSVTGDQSPSWSDSKRLSIVKEESLELEDRLTQLDRLNSNKWNNGEWDDCEYDRYQFKPTIINLSENGTTISNNGSEEQCQNVNAATLTNNSNTLTRNNANKLADICLVSRQHETKTVVVEVHRSNAEETKKTESSLTKSPSISSFNSLVSKNSTDTSNSLSSAISLELQRRSEKHKLEKTSSIDEQLQKQKLLKGVCPDKQEQHSRLMDEFKKVHRKMFQTTEEEDEKCAKLSKVIESLTIAKDASQDRETNRQFSHKVVERRSTLPLTETLLDKSSRNNFLADTSASSVPPPPPPPPKDDDGKQQSPKTDTKKPKSKVAPPVPTKYSTLSYIKEKDGYGYSSRPPPCPTPDYDTISINSNSNNKTSQKNNDVVEMESLESFKLNNPTNLHPKPPNTYFNNKAVNSPMSNGSISSNSISGKQRPVSVIIGQYPSDSLRKQPGKLDFLNNGHDEVDKKPISDSITSKLASELAYTLGRSNLKKRTESMENILNDPHQIKSQNNGTVTISLNNTLSKHFTKSTGNLNCEDNNSNRVTINISGDKKSGVIPNGILKNGNEYCDFEDMVLVESPFAQTTREGKGIRQVSLGAGLTPTKLVLATDILPSAKDSFVTYIPGVDPEIETFELVAVYPVECLNLSVFHRRQRQSLKAHFCNNRILYFELGGFEKRQMFWNLWCERVKFLCPEDPGSSHSETSVATSATNSTLYLMTAKKIFTENGIPQLWCKYGTGDATSSPKWTDRYLYMGRNMDESPMNYSPSIVPPSIAQFVSSPQKRVTKSKFSTPITNHCEIFKNITCTDSQLRHINRFANGIPEGCKSNLYLQAEHPSRTSLKVKSVPAYLRNALPSFVDATESAVKTWESSKNYEIRGRHRRRYGLAPHPHFLHGLGPWSVPSGDRFSIQTKRAVSLVTVRRQPLEPELRLPVSKRQLVASVSCEALQLNNKLSSNTNTIKTSLKRPVIFFWTPEYWYRPRSARDAYQELYNHLCKVRQYCQKRSKAEKKGTKRRLFRKDKLKKQKNVASDSEDPFDAVDLMEKRKNQRPSFRSFMNPLREEFDDCSDKDRRKKPQESSIDYLRRILRMEITLSAWDFDSTTLASQLTLIDKDLFLKIPAIELGVLICQQTSKNAPNIGAIQAFSHRISCLVATEIIRNDSEKIRARLVARLINTAEKCHKISNFQSCKSVLNGLQSPAVYRLHITWKYVRKRHASKYQVFEYLCRLYRDPRLPAYQRAFLRASEEQPFLPFLGDIIIRLLSKSETLDIKHSSNFSIGNGEIISRVSSSHLNNKCKKQQNSKFHATKKDSNQSALQKILSTLRIIPVSQNSGANFTSEQLITPENNWCEDNRILRLNKTIEFLEISQRAASTYALRRNELARDYLLKARYREERENFMNSFSIEAQNRVD